MLLKKLTRLNIFYQKITFIVYKKNDIKFYFYYVKLMLQI